MPEMMTKKEEIAEELERAKDQIEHAHSIVMQIAAEDETAVPSGLTNLIGIAEDAIEEAQELLDEPDDDNPDA